MTSRTLFAARPSLPPLLGVVLLTAALVALPWIAGIAGQGWVRLLDYALLYIMLALGLNIVVGYAGLLDLGYIAFYAVGAYLYALLASPQFGIHWPMLAILPLGALLACLFGVLLGAPTLKLRGDYLAIVTLGFGEIIRIFLNNLDRPVNVTNGPQGINLIDALQIGPLQIGTTLHIGSFSIPGVHMVYYTFVLLTLLVVLISMRLQDSRIGRAWVALREDEVAAGAMGINVRNIKLLAFAMGASFGGVAGGLFAGFQGFIAPENFGLLESVNILCMVVLGGMGNIPGVILGALLLTVAPEVMRDLAIPLQRELLGRVIIDPENLRMLLFALALILTMRWRPEGLWPSPTRRRELHAHDRVARQEDSNLLEAEQTHE